MMVMRAECTDRPQRFTPFWCGSRAWSPTVHWVSAARPDCEGGAVTPLRDGVKLP